MMIQPFGDRVLVKLVALEEKTSGGLLTVPTNKDLSNRGIVTATGEGTLLDDGSIKPLCVQVGDEVLFQPGTGLEYKTEKDSYRIISVRDILCKLVEQEDK